MITKEVKDGVRSVVLNFGLVENGEEFKYEILNKASLPFHGYSTSCGCTGAINLQDSRLDGVFPAAYTDPPTPIYIIDGHLSKQANTNNSKYIDLIDNIVVENPLQISEPIPAKEFSQSVTIYFDDGIPYKEPNEARKVETSGINQNKARVVVTMKAWIKQPTT